MRKMIIRADDVGYTDVFNIGTFAAIDGGMVTSADVMLDGFGIISALERLRSYPWLSVGWHIHNWCAPVLPAAQVPTLVENEGPFSGRFRTDVLQADDVSYEEAYRELKSELLRCREILGRVPDYVEKKKDTIPFQKAVNDLAEEFRIPNGFYTKTATLPETVEKIRRGRKNGEAWAAFYMEDGYPGVTCDPEWEDRKIVILDGQTPYRDLWTDSITSVEKNYDPVLYYTEDRAHILEFPEDVIVEQSWHPGYVDYMVYRLGERANRPRARQFVVCRTQDVSALNDDRLRNWIRNNRIELVNFRDAMYGTQSYQDHLRECGSMLAAQEEKK